MQMSDDRLYTASFVSKVFVQSKVEVSCNYLDRTPCTWLMSDTIIADGGHVHVTVCL